MFTEYTFSDGFCEFMAHIDELGNWIRVYAYKNDLPLQEKIDKTAATRNPLFLDILSPKPESFINIARRNGFSKGEQ